MRKKIGVATIIIILTLLISYSFAVSSGADKEKKDDLYRQVELFSDSLAIIQSDYVDQVEPKNLIYGALKGMLSSLDPHSQFLDPETYSELKVDTQGKFGGVGIEITIKDGLLTVVTPIEDTPAWRAGIKANDRIVKINNELTRDMTISEAVKKMRGKPGDSVNLTILRESEKKMLDLKIIRDVIKIRDIKEAKILQDGIGYIKIVQFSENTAQDFNNALAKLYRENMNALIIDLRNNPGGLLDMAVKVTERFIEKSKMIVYTKSRQESGDLKYFSGENHPILDIPLVVLINEGSASGSEIVAGCLQDYKRAIIVGVKSFGKGSVQTVIPLSDGSALRLTTSKYYTPSGKEIHGNGVMPDILAEASKHNLEESAKKQDVTADIFEQVEKSNKEPSKEEKAVDYKDDSQLMRAIDTIKAIKFYKSSDASKK